MHVTDFYHLAVSAGAESALVVPSRHSFLFHPVRRSSSRSYFLFSAFLPDAQYCSDIEVIWPHTTLSRDTSCVPTVISICCSAKGFHWNRRPVFPWVMREVCVCVYMQCTHTLSISILCNIGTQVALASGRISISQSIRHTEAENKDLETTRFTHFWYFNGIKNGNP